MTPTMLAIFIGALASGIVIGIVLVFACGWLVAKPSYDRRERI